MEVCGKEVKIKGRLVRIGSLDGEGYNFLTDPEAALGELRKSRARIDLFTFIQKLSNTSPRYGFPRDRDNLAVLPVSTFSSWWNDQIGLEGRNKAKQAEKTGVVIREVPFSDALVRGICAVYNETPIRQGRRFRQYGEDVEPVRRVSRTFPDRSVFTGVFLKAISSALRSW